MWLRHQQQCVHIGTTRLRHLDDRLVHSLFPRQLDLANHPPNGRMEPKHRAHQFFADSEKPVPSSANGAIWRQIIASRISPSSDGKFAGSSTTGVRQPNVTGPATSSESIRDAPVITLAMRKSVGKSWPRPAIASEPRQTHTEQPQAYRDAWWPVATMRLPPAVSHCEPEKRKMPRRRARLLRSRRSLQAALPATTSCRQFRAPSRSAQARAKEFLPAQQSRARHPAIRRTAGNQSAQPGQKADSAARTRQYCSRPARHS